MVNRIKRSKGVGRVRCDENDGLRVNKSEQKIPNEKKQSLSKFNFTWFEIERKKNSTPHEIMTHGEIRLIKRTYSTPQMYLTETITFVNLLN